MDVLKSLKDYIKIINEPLDIELEIAHIAYAEAKKQTPKILLFTQPVNKKTGKIYDMPVLMNLFANKEVVVKIFGSHPNLIAKKIERLFTMSSPSTIKGKFETFGFLFEMSRILPKRISKKGLCQQRLIESLDELPILKTWPKDGDKFITMGQVYTQSLDGKTNNVGMYRLQVYNSNTLGMHWQIHKDGNDFFNQYKKAEKKMPVTIAIGGDPLYTWCATAPLPPGVFELLFYGFIRKKPPKLVKSMTNDIYIPEDADIVIEGFVDPKKTKMEGEFGDHTGYYTPKELYPYLEVTKITAKKNPVFYATVVGKPPLEDRYMGWATERIFLPLIKMNSPELLDYKMPENCVFHNMVLCKISPKYPGHSLKIMHSLWGSGQMSFVKHAIFVDEKAPNLENYKELAIYILNRITKDRILITKGIVDALDHSSYEPLVGGKLGVDATKGRVKKTTNNIDDNELFKAMVKIDESIVGVKQYCVDSANPITVISVNKNKVIKHIFDKLKVISDVLSIVVFVDDVGNDLENTYMLVWRVTNNIDALKDVWIEQIIGIDATAKTDIDGFTRKWPEDVICDKDIFLSLQKRGVINLKEEEIKKFQLIE